MHIQNHTKHTHTHILRLTYAFTDIYRVNTVKNTNEYKHAHAKSFIHKHAYIIIIFIYILTFIILKLRDPRNLYTWQNKIIQEQNIMMANIVEDGRNVNRYLFSCVGVGVTVLRISAGREFQRVRAATLKDLYPKVCRCVRSGLGVNEI